MNLLTLVAAGMLSLLALCDAGIALADQRGRHDRHDHWRNRGARQEIFQDRREIQKDRAELRRDLRDYHQDREALQRAYRRGASRSEIERLRNELRQSAREVAESRQELRGDYSELRRDLDRYGWGNRGWGGGRNDSGWWGWGNRSWNHDWSRRDLDYGRD